MGELVPITLLGGPFAGHRTHVVRGSTSLLMHGGDVPEGMVARYRPTRDRSVFRFREFDRIVGTIDFGRGVQMAGEDFVVPRQGRGLTGDSGDAEASVSSSAVPEPGRPSTPPAAHVAPEEDQGPTSPASGAPAAIAENHQEAPER